MRPMVGEMKDSLNKGVTMRNSWPSREVQGRVEGTLHRQRRPGCRWLGVSAYQIRWTKERHTEFREWGNDGECFQKEDTLRSY